MRKLDWVDISFCAAMFSIAFSLIVWTIIGAAAIARLWGLIG